MDQELSPRQIYLMHVELCCSPSCKHPMNPMTSGCFLCGQFTCYDCKPVCCPDMILLDEMGENAVLGTVPSYQA